MHKKETSLLYAFQLLQIGFIVGLIISGIDKFTHLVDWSQYLSDFVCSSFGCKVNGIFMAIGVLEIALGVGMLLKPKLFSLLIAVWFLIITINLLATGVYYDLALVYGMLIMAALATRKLTEYRGKRSED